MTIVESQVTLMPRVAEPKTIIGKVFNLIRLSPRGMTGDEIGLRLPGVSPSTVASSLVSLRERGLVMPSGEYRATRHGKPARVFVRRIEQAKRKR